MATLKENVCLNRARASCLENIKVLNCWGSDLQDISLIEHMVNLEVLNVSVNNITTLRYLALCPRLKELYLRQNKIQSLDELKYLKRLPRLRVLWISNNPCTANTSYRNTVLRNLPNLKIIDGTEVNQEEINNATLVGKLIDDDEDTPGYEDLNLNQTLSKEIVENVTRKYKDQIKFQNYSHSLSSYLDDEAHYNSTEPSNNIKINMQAKRIEKEDSIDLNVDDSMFSSSSNTLRAILLLLDNLSQSELFQVNEKTTQLLKIKNECSQVELID